MALTQNEIKKVVSRASVEEARAILEAAIQRQETETRKRNRAFQRLSGVQKRVTVAQDVLEQLALRRLLPTFGTYLKVSDDVDLKFRSGDEEHEELQVHEVLAGNSCHVCGIGSLFVAAVDRADSCKVGDMSSTDDAGFMRSYLEDFFSMEQLVLIEAAFEGRLISVDGTDFDDDSPEVLAAIAFTKKLTSPAGRLKKIMGNIIEHNGTFRP